MKPIQATRRQRVGNKVIDVPYTGVFYREGERIGATGTERIYYVTFRIDGVKYEEKVGRQYADRMTPAKAANIRGDIIEGRRLPKVKQKEIDEAIRKAKEGRYTIDRLWSEYKMNRPQNRNLKDDENRYNKYLKAIFGGKEPKEIIKLDVDRVRINLLKKLSPQSVKHVLNLLTWIINYGVKNNLCDGVSFHIQKPTVQNEKTEDLSPEQLQALLESIDQDENIDVGNIMRLALFTGMRRGEIFNLKWRDINFQTGFIFIRDPKGGVDQKIPLNDMARDLLLSVHRSNSPYVFPGRSGGKRTGTGQAGKRIRDRAGLPKDFRPLHGLRHVFASMLASSGEVDMYVLQRLMTHKSPKMTQRYAHLRDEALKKGSSQIDTIMGNNVTSDKQNKKIVNFKEKAP